jgi:hypothetical protein
MSKYSAPLKVQRKILKNPMKKDHFELTIEEKNTNGAILKSLRKREQIVQLSK